MSLKGHAKPRKRLSVVLFITALLLNSCVTIPNTDPCFIAGPISEGASCKGTNTGKLTRLSMSELLDMLRAEPERTCVPVPGFSVCADDQTQGVPVKLPARAGAVLESADDYAKIKTVLEQACRELGKRCTYDMQQAIERFSE